MAADLVAGHRPEQPSDLDDPAGAPGLAADDPHGRSSAAFPRPIVIERVPTRAPKLLGGHQGGAQPRSATGGRFRAGQASARHNAVPEARPTTSPAGSSLLSLWPFRDGRNCKPQGDVVRRPTLQRRSPPSRRTTGRCRVTTSWADVLRGGYPDRRGVLPEARPVGPLVSRTLARLVVERGGRRRRNRCATPATLAPLSSALGRCLHRAADPQTPPELGREVDLGRDVRPRP